MTKRLKMVKGSGNVFLDIGFPPDEAQSLILCADLMLAIERFVRKSLIILELKRPGHKLSIDDMNQLETYLAVAKKYFKASSARGYLVGSSIDEELERRLEFRKGSEILFYANVIDSTKKRYKEFLKTIDT